MNIGLTTTSITAQMLYAYVAWTLIWQFTLFSLYFKYYNSARISLLIDLNSADGTLSSLSDLSLVNPFFYDSPLFDESQNVLILNHVSNIYWMLKDLIF